MVMSLDHAIIDCYKQFDKPADQIVTDPVLANQFYRMVCEKLPATQQLPLAFVNKRLLNLRRRGEDNGGLGRLRRRYDGRK